MNVRIDVALLRKRVATPASPASLLAPASNLATLAAPSTHFAGWSGAEIESMGVICARLRVLGMSDDQADALAEKLTNRRRELDDRVLCAIDCANYSAGRCRNSMRAGVGQQLGELATQLQRCPGFTSRGANHRKESND